MIGKASKVLEEYPYSHVYRDYIRVAHEYWNHPVRPGLVIWEIISISSKSQYHKDHEIDFSYYCNEEGHIAKSETNKVATILKAAGFIRTSTTKGSNEYNKIRKPYAHINRKNISADKIIEDFEAAISLYRSTGDEIQTEEPSS